jgi:hypothetical protein
MRKRLVLGLLAISPSTPPGPALAGPYATEFTQVLNHVERIRLHARQAVADARRVALETAEVRRARETSPSRTRSA